MRNDIKHLALIVFLISLGACSTSRFDRQWNAMAKDPDLAVPADDVTGLWEGQWDDSVHVGELRAIVSKKSPQVYRMFFSARYWGWARSTYKLDMMSSDKGMPKAFEGSHKLFIFGPFLYEGNADGKGFSSTFSSKRFKGEFKMKRPDVSPGR